MDVSCEEVPKGTLGRNIEKERVPLPKGQLVPMAQTMAHQDKSTLGGLRLTFSCLSFFGDV